ncbi:MAG: hypothetical protein IT326_04850, partial [Anaerolineae bacterium]|nr:hypothetical protein [Anaerolineae bacterium]
DLAHRLTHPRYEHPKTYHVLVAGSPGEATLDQWRFGVVLDGVRTAPAEVRKLRRDREGTLLEVVVHEGRKRMLRRVAAVIGHPVLRLVRMKIGPVELGELEPGAWRRLNPDEVTVLQALRDQPEIRLRRRPPVSARPRKGVPKGVRPAKPGERPAPGGRPAGARPVSGGRPQGGSRPSTGQRGAGRPASTGPVKPAGSALRSGAAPDGAARPSARPKPSSGTTGSSRPTPGTKPSSGPRPATSRPATSRPATSRPPGSGGRKPVRRRPAGGTGRK